LQQNDQTSVGEIAVHLGHAANSINDLVTLQFTKGRMNSMEVSWWSCRNNDRMRSVCNELDMSFILWCFLFLISQICCYYTIIISRWKLMCSGAWQIFLLVFKTTTWQISSWNRNNGDATAWVCQSYW
jgi:hypothetical protein